MSHGITATDGVFSVRKPMWHKLGNVLTDYPTRAEAQAIAHPFEVVQEPVYRRATVVAADGTLTEEFQEIPDQRANVRDSNGEVLGIVSDTYGLVTIQELYDVAEAVQGVDPSLVKYETGGSLFGGRKVWLLLRLAEPIQVGKDPNGLVLPYFALQNAFDGSGSFRGQALLDRIVCHNTSLAADWEAQTRGTEVVFRHTKNVTDRVEEARQALTGWRQSIEAWNHQANYLAGMPVTPRQRELFVTKFVPMPKAQLISDRVAANVEADRAQLRAIFDSPTCEGIKDNAYGLVQGAVEFRNHFHRAKNEETRFHRTYLNADKFTSGARRIAEAVATA